MRRNVVRTRIETWSVLAVTAAACGSHERAVAHDPTSACSALFDRYYDAIDPFVARLGIAETKTAARTRNAAGLATCEHWAPEVRSCMRWLPATARSWALCRVEPPFALFQPPDPMRALGAPVAKADSDRRIAALAGTWVHPSVGRSDAITWTLSPTGALAVHTVSIDPAGALHERDQTYQLAFARERQLALSSGSSTQFVPALVDGDRLYVSWTSGAFAIPIADPNAVALDLADRGRWLVWQTPACTVLDPQRGPASVTCHWEGDQLRYRDDLDGVPHERAWTKRGNALVHPAMELFTRQGK